MPLRPDTPEFDHARNDLIEILEGWARDGHAPPRQRSYGRVAELLNARDPRRRLLARSRAMSLLLEAACRKVHRDLAEEGVPQPPMITAIVVYADRGYPGAQFTVLARKEPFSRQDPDWSWQVERERVLDFYQTRAA